MPYAQSGRSLSRPHFSPRQLVTAADLNAGVDYLVERARRHNRYLHGCGIACGLMLALAPTFDRDLYRLELEVAISGGTAISPNGDTIVVEATSETYTKARALDGTEIDLGLLVYDGQGQPARVYLLVRHVWGDHPDHLRPTLPDDCHPSGNGRSPTRLSEGYEFILSTTLPPACARPNRNSCGEGNALLDRRSPEHEAALMRLLTCPPPVAGSEWLVVGTIVLWVERGEGVRALVHYNDRTLLPSAQALQALLSCFPDTPRIDSATVFRAFWEFGPSYYIARVRGVGLAPLLRIEIDNNIYHTVLSHNDNEVVFWLWAPTQEELRLGFRIETQFDVIDSADCGVYLEISPDLPFEPDGVIGGGNL